MTNVANAHDSEPRRIAENGEGAREGLTNLASPVQFWCLCVYTSVGLHRVQEEQHRRIKKAVPLNALWSHLRRDMLFYP